jgi:excisionase family DNA binding protein
MVEDLVSDVERVLADAKEALAETRLLEVQHVAHRLRASQEYVRRRIRDGSLSAFRLSERGPWRITEEALREFIAVQQRATGCNKTSTSAA